MLESPQSLLDISISFICKNIHTLYDVPRIRNAFLFSDIFIPSNIAERLLEELGKDAKINDRVLFLFNSQVSRLQKIRINNASKITSRGLGILRYHKIHNVEIRYLSKLSVNELIACFGEWTVRNLEVLNVSHCTFRSFNKICIMVALSKLKSLRVLDVSNTEFNLRGLDIVAQDLPLLENLNISGTHVRDISPLRRCKERLKVLKMYNLRISHRIEFLGVLLELKNLYYLDISCDGGDPFTLGVTSNGLKITEFLKCTNCVPRLASLDISGTNGINDDDVRKFLASHRDLTFLGLMLTPACFYDMFINETDQHFNPELLVSGCGSFNQVINSLQRYMTRKSYVQKSLYFLYSYTQTSPNKGLDVLKLVIEGMRTYQYVLSIQIAASACLYNLTKGILANEIHPRWLKEIVELTLIAMKNYPRHQQLQKNALLTLCSDRILQDVNFDRFTCAELVMESLVTFNDLSMNRMSVAICSILVAKISTTETSALGTKTTYMERLLQIVSEKTVAVEVDMMMKFTLSVLWNLTDESPATCEALLEMNGMELLLRVLDKFVGEASIETKVLGLVNNIAEVGHLHVHLMKDEFISKLRLLLHSTHVDVSYFAAGIVAHLASGDINSWSCTLISKKEILQDLSQVILNWEAPETEMVAYRSFTPFFPLLKCYEAPEVQLWAVWAIHHVCSKNAKRYYQMLLEENGVHFIENLLQDKSLDASIAELCHKILTIVNNPLVEISQ